MNEMTEILFLVSILTPMITALTEVVKKAVNTPLNIIPVIALFIGLLVGFAAQPFSGLDLYLRLWAGAIAGLTATGLYEALKQRDGESKGDK